MDAEKYINEANQQLSDKLNYKKLQEDPTLQHSNLVNDTIDRFNKKNLLLKNWLADWNQSTQKPQCFTFHPSYIKETTQEDQW